MNCYVCARDQLDSVAVAVCPHCGAALCLMHVEHQGSMASRGGLYTSCSHDTWSSTTARQTRKP